MHSVSSFACLSLMSPLYIDTMSAMLHSMICTLQGPASMGVMQGVNGMGPFASASMNSMASPGMQSYPLSTCCHKRLHVAQFCVFDAMIDY